MNYNFIYEYLSAAAQISQKNDTTLACSVFIEWFNVQHPPGFCGSPFFGGVAAVITINTSSRECFSGPTTRGLAPYPASQPANASHRFMTNSATKPLFSCTLSGLTGPVLLVHVSTPGCAAPCQARVHHSGELPGSTHKIQRFFPGCVLDRSTGAWRGCGFWRLLIINHSYFGLFSFSSQPCGLSSIYLMLVPKTFFFLFEISTHTHTHTQESVQWSDFSAPCRVINASPESFVVIGEKYSLLCQIERRFATGWLVTGWRAEGKKPKIYKKDNNRGIWEGVGRGGKSEIGPKSVYNKAFAPRVRATNLIKRWSNLWSAIASQCGWRKLCSSDKMQANHIQNARSFLRRPGQLATGMLFIVLFSYLHHHHHHHLQ